MFKGQLVASYKPGCSPLHHEFLLCACFLLCGDPTRYCHIPRLFAVGLCFVTFYFDVTWTRLSYAFLRMPSFFALLDPPLGTPRRGSYRFTFCGLQRNLRPGLRRPDNTCERVCATVDSVGCEHEQFQTVSTTESRNPRRTKPLLIKARQLQQPAAAIAVARYPEFRRA